MNANPGVCLTSFLVLCFTAFAQSQLPAAETFLDSYNRAEAAFAQQRFSEASRLALDAAAQAETEQPPATNRLILAIELAGKSAYASRQVRQARLHYDKALTLTVGLQLEKARPGRGGVGVGATRSRRGSQEISTK